MGTVLVTGFEAFGGEPENPSALIAQAREFLRTNETHKFANKSRPKKK